MQAEKCVQRAISPKARANNHLQTRQGDCAGAGLHVWRDGSRSRFQKLELGLSVLALFQPQCPVRVHQLLLQLANFILDEPQRSEVCAEQGTPTAGIARARARAASGPCGNGRRCAPMPSSVPAPLHSALPQSAAAQPRTSLCDRPQPVQGRLPAAWPLPPAQPAGIRKRETSPRSVLTGLSQLGWGRVQRMDSATAHPGTNPKPSRTNNARTHLASAAASRSRCIACNSRDCSIPMAVTCEAV